MVVDKYIPKDIVSITLTEEEIEIAKDAGVRRQKNAVVKNIMDAHGFSGDGLRIHQQGCIAEYATAKWLNVDWVDFSVDFKELTYDVGEFQIRSTDFKYGRLLLHHDDPDDQIFILVRIDRMPTIDLVGWIIGKHGKREVWWDELLKNRPCFIVPNRELHLMENLEWEAAKA